MAPSSVANRSIPIGVLLEEAMLVAALVDDHWAPKRGPGLADAGAPGLGPDVGKRLRALVAKSRKVAAKRAPSAADEHAALRRRAWKVLSDLGATLRYAARDPSSAPLPEHVARLARRWRRRPEAATAIALALDEHAAIAEVHLARLRTIPAFDPRWIADARALVPELRAILTRHRAYRAATTELSRARQAAVGEILALVHEIRAAARFVFRDDPDLVRKFGSAHARKQQAKWRAARRAAKAAS